MRRVAVFADAGYFWVQIGTSVLGKKADRAEIKLDYERLRAGLLGEVAAQFPNIDLLRVYWYDGPSHDGRKTSHHRSIERLDDFKLRLGTRNGAGQQKAVDGLIIADMLSLAQTKAITDALLVSGDADMTPSLVAAQNLGLRVHLLIIGSDSATSPYLSAESDRKVYWDAKAISGFAQPEPVTATAAPAAGPMPTAAASQNPLAAANPAPTPSSASAAPAASANTEAAVPAGATPSATPVAAAARSSSPSTASPAPAASAPAATRPATQPNTGAPQAAASGSAANTGVATPTPAGAAQAAPPAATAAQDSSPSAPLPPPATPAPGAAGPATPPNTGAPQIAAPASAAIAAAASAVDWTAIAKAIHERISTGSKAGDLAGLSQKSMRLPPPVDVALLRAGAKATGRSLEEHEKRTLRVEFKRLLPA